MKKISLDKCEFQRALEKIEGEESLEEVKKDILNSVFLWNMDGVKDAEILKYREKAQKIVNKHFGEGAWGEFINSIREKNEK